MDLFSGLEPPPPPKRQDANNYLAETMPAAPPPPPIADDGPPLRFVSASPPPPRIPKPEDFPGKPVASFACYCGAQDEVLEPAPEWVDCWEKGCGAKMHRWYPRTLPPSNNARQLTEAERSRI